MSERAQQTIFVADDAELSGSSDRSGFGRFLLQTVVIASVLLLQPDFGRSTSFPMAFPGPLLVPAAPARPGARSRMVRRSAPDQVPQQAAHFRHGERQQIGLAIECAFFPLRLCSEARQDRRGPASPA